MIIYRVDDGIPHPVQVKCELFHPGERDADGQTIYVNTHFADSREAWVKLMREARAGQELSTRDFEQAQAALKRATEQLARDAAFRTTVEQAFEELDTPASEPPPRDDPVEDLEASRASKGSAVELVLSICRDRWCSFVEIVGEGADRTRRANALQYLLRAKRIEKIGERKHYQYRAARVPSLAPVQEAS